MSNRGMLCVWLLLALAGCGGAGEESGDPVITISIRHDGTRDDAIDFLSVTRMVEGIPESEPVYTDGRSTNLVRGDVSTFTTATGTYRFAIEWWRGDTDVFTIVFASDRDASWMINVWPGGHQQDSTTPNGV